MTATNRPTLAELEDLHARATGIVIKEFNRGRSVPLAHLLYEIDGAPQTQQLPLDLMVDIFTDKGSAQIRKKILQRLAFTLLSSGGPARKAMEKNGEHLPRALIVVAAGTIFEDHDRCIITFIFTPNQSYLARSAISGQPPAAALGELVPLAWSDLDVVDMGRAN